MAQFDSTTTRMPGGLTNADPTQTMAASGVPDPTWSQLYVEDFNTYTAGDFTNTTVGTGTVAQISADGGQLLLTNTAGASDSIYLQLVAAGFKVTPGKALFFKFKGTLSEITNNVFYAGLLALDTTPQDDANGIYIRRLAGPTAVFQLIITVATVTSVFPFPAALLPVAGVPFEVGFMVDYLGNVAGFFNPGTGDIPMDNANVPVGRVVAAYAPSLPSALLAPSFGLLNNTAAARTLAVDFVVASRER